MSDQLAPAIGAAVESKANGSRGVIVGKAIPHGWKVQWDNGAIGYHGANAFKQFLLVIAKADQ